MRKRKETNDYTFLVDDVKEIVDKDYKFDMMNMLGYLAYRHTYYTEHRKAHNGFFYVSAEDIHNEVGITKNTVPVYALRFVKDKLIDYSSGTTHHPSNYRLLWDIKELEVHHPEAQDVYTPQKGVVQEAENEVSDCNLGTSIKNKEKRKKNEEKEERIGTSEKGKTETESIADKYSTSLLGANLLPSTKDKEGTIANGGEDWIEDSDPTERRLSKVKEDIKKGVFYSETALLTRIMLDSLNGYEDVLLDLYKHSTPIDIE